MNVSYWDPAYWELKRRARIIGEDVEWALRSIYSVSALADSLFQDIEILSSLVVTLEILGSVVMVMP
jgi:hypothetical protein